MNFKEDNEENYETWKQPFPALLWQFIFIAVLVVIVTIISAIFYLQATVLALIGLFVAKSFLIKRDALTFIEEEYDLDIHVEEKINQEKPY